MPRGRHYYDPIVQNPTTVKSASSRRIELYPEQDVRDNAVALRWVGRLVDASGVVLDKARGSYDHDDALRQAQELWPGLEVYELREESEDSTHEGFGPSPRLWQGSVTERVILSERDETFDLPSESLDVTPAGEAPVVRALTVGAPGTYIRLEDVLACLEEYAAQFDEDNNPSAALGIRQAATALAEPF